MKQYFLQVNCYIPKNKAHEAVQSFIMQYNKCLFDKLRLHELIQLLKYKVKEINLAFPRCQDIAVDHRLFRDGVIYLAVESNFHCSITEVQRYEVARNAAEILMIEALQKVIGSMSLERVERFDLLEQCKEALAEGDR